MPRLPHILCLAGACGLWSCSKGTDSAAAQPADAAAATAQTTEAAAANAATGAPQVETNAAGQKVARVTPEQASQIADRLIAAGNYSKALPLLTQIINANPKDASAYVKRAAILAENKLLTQAVADMSRAIALEPDNARHHNTRGYFLLSQQNLDAALQDFNDAIGLDVNFAQPHNNRGLVRIAKGELEKAVKDFEEALKVDAKYLDAHNNLGYALMRLDRHDEAIASFSNAIEIDPKYVNAWNNRAQARLKADRAEDALTDFTEAIRLAPGNSSYYLGRADAYEKLGRAEESQQDRDHIAWMQELAGLTQQALQSPKVAGHWVARGRHLLRRNEAQAAVADFGRALQLAPESIDARCGHAAALLLLGKLDEAIADCNIALSKDAHPLALSLRGDAYFARGELDYAIEDYATAKRMDRQVARAYLKRSEIRKADGDTQNAEADYQHALELDPSLGTIQQASAEQPATN
ncbi:MAG: tetratricopeptide repeat protein [Planctomyces sp.]|nr:tetratricopeptide repeat protein [Planctomyces sp.]